MISRVLAFALAGMAQANEIAPDWKKLTDFSTDIKVNLASILAKVNENDDREFQRCLKEIDDPRYCRHHGPGLKTYEGEYHAQLDVAGERLKLAGSANCEYNNNEEVPPLFRGQTAKGTASLAFDAAAGFVFVKEKGTVNSQMGPFSFEFCARVHFPQGLFPPGSMIMGQLDKKKQQITDGLNHMPHTDATVDGNNVAVYSVPAHPPNAPAQFAAIMHDATPVGYGINNAPSGTWEDASIKFNGWTTGAGTIADEGCVTMSATELLQSVHANRTLFAFDQMVGLMKNQEPLKSVLAFVPEQPSQIFASAARLESLAASSTHLNENTKVEISSPSSWATVAMAIVGGVVGASLVLVLSKTRASVRAPPLLE